MDLELVKIIGNYGIGTVCVAVLVFLHVYNIHITLPKAAEIATAHLNKLVETFRDELRAERDHCHKDHTEILKVCLDSQQALARLLERKGSAK